MMVNSHVQIYLHKKIARWNQNFSELTNQTRRVFIISYLQSVMLSKLTPEFRKFFNMNFQTPSLKELSKNTSEFLRLLKLFFARYSNVLRLLFQHVETASCDCFSMTIFGSIEKHIQKLKIAYKSVRMLRFSI